MRIKLNAQIILILLSSGCYWAWFDATIFRPTLFMPFSDSSEFYSIYFITAIASSAIVLLIVGVRRARIAQSFKAVPCCIVLVLLVLAGSLLTMLGSFLLSPVFIFLGALLTGGICSVFLLGWARIYSSQGARSACFYISGGIAIGAMLDILIIELTPLFAAFFALALPLIFILFLVNSYNSLGAAKTEAAQNVIDDFPDVPSKSDTEESSEQSLQSQKLTLKSLFASSRFHFFGLSFSLIAAFFLFGLAFGFMQYNTAFFSPELYPFSSDALLISRGITSLLVFLAIYFFPKHIYTVFRVGILIGIAGFIAVPLLSTLANHNLIIGFVIAIGYTTFDIITWTILSELAFVTKEGTRATFGPGRFVVHISIFAGFLLAMLLASHPQTLELKQAFYSTVGFLLVIGEVLLLSENSALWMLIRPHTTGNIESTAEVSDYHGEISYSSRRIAQVIETYRLTEREAEILRYLLLGRSRPRIAQILCISENTVSSHIQNIYHKLDVHGLQELLDRFS